MSDNKKAAEGPFKKVEGPIRDILKFGDTTICNWEDVYDMTEFFNEAAKRYLKSPSGKMWMEENGVGGRE